MVMKNRLSTLLFVAVLTLAARADITLVFNEIMYHPRSPDAAGEARHEWVELYNQLAVDLDVSNWRVAGEIDFTFPPDTRIPGRGFIVLAWDAARIAAETGITNILAYGDGSITNNRLGNGGGPLRLYNNAGRLMDEVNYGTDGEWPVPPDGSGVSLAKRDRDFGGANPANWTWSAQVGGTPGGDNFALDANVRLIAVDNAWRYEASGTDLGTAWRERNYDDSSWSERYFVTNRSIPTLFNTGVDNDGNVIANNSPDPHYVLTVAAQGTVGAQATVIANHPAWLGNDSVSKWIGVADGSQNVNFGNYSYRTGFSLDDFILSTVQINMLVAVDNDLSNVFLNGTPKGITFSGFAAYSSPIPLTGFTAGSNSLEFATVNAGTSANPHGFRVVYTSSGLSLNTNAPPPNTHTTYYFRRAFLFTDDPRYATLTIDPVLADGAVVYLNGVEVYRQNLPGGAIDYTTPANSNAVISYAGVIPIAASSLVNGTNVLAVEVHQASGSPDGPVIGIDMIYNELPAPPVTLAFNEFNGTTNNEFWVELLNYGTNAFALEGMLVRYDATNDAAFAIPTGTTLNAGEFLVLSNSTLGFTQLLSGERLYLQASNLAAVYDGVVLKKGPRARHPDGTGAWLVPGALTPGAANSFSFRNEIVINEIMYHHKVDPPFTTNIPPKDNPEAWIELYNRGTNSVDLGDWRLAGDVSFNFRPGTTLAPGAYLVIADDVDAFRATHPGVTAVGNLGGRLSRKDDRIVLEDPVGNPADEVQYYSSGRWPEYADGGGSSLELRDPNADNSKAEAWAPSDESGSSDWVSYTYRMIANASPTPNPDAQWRDFVFGLLSGGEVLIDDIAVTQNPTNAPIQFLDNGNFENGLTGWRVLGNHGRSFVEPEPGNPGNKVLHLVASGAQEHMHNHVEATLSGGRSITNGQLYQVSFRAKWLAGSHLLNTRAYFNRIARTTPLAYPTLNGTPGARNSRYATNIGPTFAGFGHAPIAPQVNQAVTVRVQASDPQGVTNCEVFYSVNGGTWASAPMTLQNGLYAGTIPGQASGALVQFYVRAVDALGAAATFPARGPDSGAFYRVFDNAAILSPLHNIRILMSPANTALLHASTNVMSNETLPATIVYDERIAYYDVGNRLKSSERGRDNSARVGFHIEFQADEPFRGVHPMMLIDRSNGGSRPANEEIILRHMMLHAGIPNVHVDLVRVLSPRTSEYGTAIFGPRFEDEFVENQYENGGDGTLFEMELIYYPTSANAAGYKLPQPDAVQGLDYGDYGGNKELYRYNFIIKNHRDEDDYARFIPMSKAFNLSGAQLDQQTKLTMDVDQWMRAYALVSLSGVGDMYTFGNNHNWMNYLRPSDQKMLYFPWDMDFSFNSGPTSGLIGNQRFANVVSLPGNLRCFYAHIQDHIATTYNTNYMAYWIDHYGRLAGQNYSGDNGYIAQRAAFALSQIPAANLAVNGTNFASTGSNTVVLTGTAPIQAKTITINGVAYPITWTSATAWSITLPIGEGTNSFEVVAADVNGVVLSNITRTVVLTNALPDPRGLIVFNEIMYNPYLPDAGYVELFNLSSNVTFDVGGWRINGLAFTFPAGKIIGPRQYAVVAANAAAYAGAYGLAGGTPIAEFLEGNLQNDGETLTLIKPAASSNEVDLVVDRIRYEGSAPWSTNANGTGSSLQLIDPNQENARVANWFSTYIPPVFSEEISTPAMTNDGWRFVSVTGSSGGGAGGTGANRVMRLLLNLSVVDTNGAVAIIDDLQLVGGTNAGVGSNFIRNGDFETLPLIEDPALTNSWHIGTNYTNTVITSDLTHSGNGALRIECATFGNAFPRLIHQYLSPAPPTNAIHTLSFWFWATNSAQALQIRIQNSSALNVTTNLAITYVPSNYVPSEVVRERTNSLSPGAANQLATNLPPFPPLWINEVQAENLSGVTDSYGEREPWIEIYNASTNAVSLEGLFLSSTFTNLTNWAFPSGSSIGPTQFLVVFCDGQELQTSNTEYHTSFRLPVASGAIALSRIHSNGPAAFDGPQVLDYVNYAGLHADRSYGSFPDGQPFDRMEFFYVTPRGTNDGRSAPLPVFINEWLASNVALEADPADDDYDDWFEIYNPTTNAVSLAGYFLTDTTADKTKFEITTNMAHVVPPRGYLLVWADNETGQNLSAGVPRPDLHVNFQLARAGEVIGLYAADGTAIDLVAFGTQTDDVTEGRYPDGSANLIAMPGTASPRAANYISGASNTPPVLDPIGDKIIYLGQTLTFTATASDTDLPAQVLTYSLIGAPAGATIGNGSGVFTWTPGATGTNSLTVRVTDNGTPAAFDEETIAVEVLAHPGFARTVRNGDNVELTWGTRAGKRYAVDGTESLNPPVTWTPLGTNTATGDSMSFTNATTNAPQQFFRIRTVD